MPTRVVMLGTGTPRPDPNRSGPATAIIVNDTPYLIDFGPGVIRRAAAAFEKGVTALGYGGTHIKTVFLTHMHSDHTAGYPDLIFTPWVMGRREPLVVYGPKGITAMTEHVLKAWQVDVNARTGGLNQHNPTGYRSSRTRSCPVSYIETTTSWSRRFPRGTKRWWTPSVTGSTRPIDPL